MSIYVYHILKYTIHILVHYVPYSTFTLTLNLIELTLVKFMYLFMRARAWRRTIYSRWRQRHHINKHMCVSVWCCEGVRRHTIITNNMRWNINKHVHSAFREIVPCVCECKSLTLIWNSTAHKRQSNGTASFRHLFQTLHLNICAYELQLCICMYIWIYQRLSMHTVQFD